MNGEYRQLQSDFTVCESAVFCIGGGDQCKTGLGRFYSSMYKWGLLPRRIASVAPPIKPQTTLSQRAPYIGYLEGWLVWRFWMMILDAGLIPPQPASDPIGFLDAPPYEEEV